jgi:hypothetical protein
MKIYHMKCKKGSNREEHGAVERGARRGKKPVKNP